MINKYDPIFLLATKMISKNLSISFFYLKLSCDTLLQLEWAKSPYHGLQVLK